MVVHSFKETKMISLHKFYFDAISRTCRTGERYGQAMFNHLSEVRPELAEAVRGTEMDPFHVQRINDPRWDKFVEFIEMYWRTPILQDLSASRPAEQNNSEG
jgi:hypothetical protein